MPFSLVDLHPEVQDSVNFRFDENKSGAREPRDKPAQCQRPKKSAT